MDNLGKLLIYIGIAVLAIGSFLWLGSKLGIGFGKLPGDVSMQTESSSFFFPITTCIIISIVLTVLVNLFFWFRR